MTSWRGEPKSHIDASIQEALDISRNAFSSDSELFIKSVASTRLCINCTRACMNCVRYPSYVGAHHDGYHGLYAWLYRDLLLRSTWGENPKDSSTPFWSKSKKDFMRVTSPSGCHLCIIIARAFHQASIATFAKMDVDQTLKYLFEYRTAERDPSGKLDYDQRTRMPLDNIVLLDQMPAEFWLELTPKTVEMISHPPIHFRMQPLTASSCGDAIHTDVKAHVSTGNRQNFELGLKWLENCRNYHKMCILFRPGRQDWRPSRLIYVGDDFPRLSVSSDNKGSLRYCALSYCWGKNQNVVLTRNTLFEYQQHLPVEILPTTIRDAITFTKSIKCLYLWIDALCIIQDSQEDWEDQSSQMGAIYGLATLTIAAGGTSNVTEGMFCRRDPRTVRPCVVHIGGGPGPFVRITPWVVYPSNAEQRIAQAFHDNPLSRRAWTLQERILSPRVLMFGENQILWSCVTMEACETFPSGLHPQFSTPLSEMRSLANLRQRLMTISTTSEGSPSEFWDDVVQMYSKTDLTMSSDKLVALHGFVTRLTGGLRDETKNDTHQKEVTSYKYMAGIWYDKNVKQQLLWRTKQSSVRSRPKSYRAPSWSWAAIDGEILPFEQYIFWAWTDSEFELATVLDIHAEPLLSHKGSHTGQVSGGYLDLRCFLRRCFLYKSQSPTKSHPDESICSDAIIVSAQTWEDVQADISSSNDSNLMIRNQDKSMLFTEYCTLDCPDDIPSSQWVEVYCVPIDRASLETDRYERPIWESYEGLILRNVREQEVTNERPQVRPQSQGPRAKPPADPELRGNIYPSAVSHTFSRVGLFAYHINDENRNMREDALFGPTSDLSSKMDSRDRFSIRVI